MYASLGASAMVEIARESLERLLADGGDADVVGRRVIRKSSLRHPPDLILPGRNTRNNSERDGIANERFADAVPGRITRFPPVDHRPNLVAWTWAGERLDYRAIAERTDCPKS